MPPLRSIPFAIALGSNLGDRRAHLEWALAELAPHVTALRSSSFIETEPEGVPDRQPPYLNAAAVGETRLSAAALLELLLDCERRRGRERRGVRAARTLDLDLILFGDTILSTPPLEVPHPRFRERRFVLEPLAEIAPEWIDPVTRLTVRELLDRIA